MPERPTRPRRTQGAEFSAALALLTLAPLTLGRADARWDRSRATSSPIAISEAAALSEDATRRDPIDILERRSSSEVDVVEPRGLEPRSPPEPEVALLGGHRVFLGNLHAHTSYSDGSGTPAQAYAYAVARGKLDFLAVTEHNHARAEDGAGDRRDGLLIATNPSLYAGDQPSSLVSAARAAQREGHFVALFGQEFSTISSGNHVNVFDVTSVIRVDDGDFEALLTEWLPAHPDTSGSKPLVQLNHPSGQPNEYGQDDFPTRAAWIAALDSYAELVEIFNGPGTRDGSDLEPQRFTGAYLKLLDLGFHLGPTGNQDNHYFTWGTLSSTRTGVIARSLTKGDLIAALKARHVFASLDANLRVVAEVLVDDRRYLMGDLAPPPRSGEFRIAYHIRDDDEPEADYRIDVLTDVPGDGRTATTLESIRVSGARAASGVIEGLAFTSAGQYVLLRVTQLSHGEKNDSLWTAPVWFEGAPAVLPVATPPRGASETTTSEAVASKNSDVYHPDPTCRSARAIAPHNRLRGAEAERGRRPHQGCPN